MNLQYFPTTSLQASLQTSHALWLYVYPSCLPTDGTQYVYSTITDINGTAWATIDLDYQISVAPESTGINFLAAIQAAIQAGVLQAPDLDFVQAAIVSSQGKTVVVSKLLPPGFLAQGQTLQQMQLSGRLPDPVQAIGQKELL